MIFKKKIPFVSVYPTIEPIRRKIIPKSPPINIMVENILRSGKEIPDFYFEYAKEEAIQLITVEHHKELKVQEQITISYFSRKEILEDSLKAIETFINEPSIEEDK